MRTAIVAEGGGQRGIYTAGVLDALLEARVNPFTDGFGVSAGAQNLLAYFLEQPGFARRAIAELTAAPDFFVPYRWFGARGVIDLDGYFERAVHGEDFRLPYQRLGELDGRRRLVFVATDRDSLEALYLEPDASNVIEWLKASSAVPFLYRSGVSFGARTLVDGGVADPLPVREAYARGARRMLVVRTVQSGGEGCAGWRQRLAQVRRAGALPQALARMLERQESACAAAEAFLAEPPPDLELLELRPRAALASQVFGSRSEALVADYHTGRADGERTLAALARWDGGSARRVRDDASEASRRRARADGLPTGEAATV